MNLDMLGRRPAEHYGTFTLDELELKIKRFARELGLEPRFFQTNHEGELVEHLHQLTKIADGAIINAGAWTHYSYAIRDALELAGIPAVEVHISDVDAREDWRRRSVLDGLVADRIAGEGAEGYRRALEILRERLA